MSLIGPPVVVLDANALRRDRFFRSHAYRLLVREAREDRLRLVVPEVALDEALNLYREDVLNQHNAVRRAAHELKQLRAPIVLDEDGFDVNRAEDRYSEMLGSVFDAAGVHILPYPDVPHADVVERALRRARPFAPDGKDGYRDTLVWESVKVLCVAEEGAALILVSGDWRAFSPSPDSREILPHLLIELESAGVRSADITRVPDVRTFTDENIPNVDARLVEVEHRLATEPEFAQTVIEEITGRLLALSVDHPMAGSTPIDINAEIERIEVDWVDDVRHLRIISAKQWDDALLLEIQGEASVGLEVTVRRVDVGALRPHAYPEEPGDGLVVSGSVEADIDLMVEATYRDDTIQVETVDEGAIGL